MKKVFSILFIILLFIGCSSNNESESSDLTFKLGAPNLSLGDKECQIWLYYPIQEGDTADDIRKKGPTYKSKTLRVGDSFYIEYIPIGLCYFQVMLIDGNSFLYSLTGSIDIVSGHNEIEL